jgi:hypothetical protein
MNHNTIPMASDFFNGLLEPVGDWDPISSWVSFTVAMTNRREIPTVFDSLVPHRTARSSARNQRRLRRAPNLVDAGELAAILVQTFATPGSP